MERENFKPNSAKSKEAQPLEKKVGKVVEGTVVTRKKNALYGFAELFLPEDVTDIKRYILTDVIIPKLKDIADETFRSFLYGGGGGRKSNSPGSRVSYSGYYDRENPRRGREQRPARQNYSYDDIVIATRGAAEEVLSSMHELTCLYGVVTVADFYDLVGVTRSYTDNNYGWTDVNNAQVIRVRDGYLIKLPKALPIN